MASVSILSILFFAACALVSAIALRLGLRWREETVAPTCRRCGYDVSGRPAGVERCSECGADLTRPRATTIVRRRASRPIVAVATVVLVATLAITATLALRFDWPPFLMRSAPTAIIAWLARHDPSAAGDRYRDEWARRGLPAAYVDHLLDLQGDRAVPQRWQTDQPLYDLWIRYLRGEPGMTAAQADRYARQRLGSATLRVVPPVRVGGPLRVEVTCAARDFLTPYAVRYVRYSLDARASGDVTLDPRRDWMDVPSSTAREIPADEWGGVGIAPGTHKVHVRLRRQIGLGFDETRPDEHEMVGPAIDAEATFDIEVVPGVGSASC